METFKTVAFAEVACQELILYTVGFFFLFVCFFSSHTQISTPLVKIPSAKSAFSYLRFPDKPQMEFREMQVKPIPAQPT